MNRATFEFIKHLKRYSDKMPKQTLRTIRGQALAGDLEGAKCGLNNTLMKGVAANGRPN